MVSLEECLSKYKGLSDDEVILKYISNNGLEGKFLSLIPIIVKSSLDKKETEVSQIKTNLGLFQNIELGVKDVEVSSSLNRIQVYAAMGYPLDKDSDLIKWCKDNLIKIKRPINFPEFAMNYLKEFNLEFKPKKEASLLEGLSDKCISKLKHCIGFDEFYNTPVKKKGHSLPILTTYRNVFVGTDKDCDALAELGIMSKKSNKEVGDIYFVTDLGFKETAKYFSIEILRRT